MFCILCALCYTEGELEGRPRASMSQAHLGDLLGAGHMQHVGEWAGPWKQGVSGPELQGALCSISRSLQALIPGLLEHPCRGCRARPALCSRKLTLVALMWTGIGRGQSSL